MKKWEEEPEALVVFFFCFFFVLAIIVKQKVPFPFLFFSLCIGMYFIFLTKITELQSYFFESS